MVKEISFIRDILGRLQQANEESKCLHKPKALKALHTWTNVDIVAVLKRDAGGPHKDFGHHQAAEEAKGAYGLPGVKAADDGRVQRDGGPSIFHGNRGVLGGRGDIEDYIKWCRNGREGATVEGGAGAQEGKVFETVLEIQDRHNVVKEIEGKYGTL
uniref:Uncharacterized protein n=1 Tax=Nelumbo nucifera TaxID=4432 RepID=A0A822YJR0_NELNU|nr:TPA_asm: hypothetical protein HUJ06_010056 [Nelumbo nucifera]